MSTVPPSRLVLIGARGVEPLCLAALDPKSSVSARFHQAPRLRQEGLEPSRPFGHRLLRPARIPFRHCRVFAIGGTRTHTPFRGPAPQAGAYTVPPRSLFSRATDAGYRTLSAGSLPSPLCYPPHRRTPATPRPLASPPRLIEGVPALIRFHRHNEYAQRDLNPRQPACKASALPLSYGRITTPAGLVPAYRTIEVAPAGFEPATHGV